MKLSRKFKKALMMAMVVSTAMSTAYAAPVVASVTTVSESDGEESPDSQTVAVPKFFGTGTAVVPLHDSFDPLRGVAAYDGNGKDITDKIKISGTVNTSDPGVYYLTYTVTDENGILGKVVRTVIVDGNIRPEREETEFTGVDDIEIDLFDTFNPMAGVRAMDSMDGDITRDVKVTSFVNTEKPGEYLVIYSVTNSGNMEKVVYRKVTVVGELLIAPTLEGAEDVMVELGSTFDILKGVKATDKDGMDITSRITTEGHLHTGVVGRYYITYKVMDNTGMETIVIRRVEVIEKEVNKTTFFGVQETTIEVGDTFIPLSGVTALDPVDGDITNKVRALSYVNPSKPGGYLVIYSVTNSQGVTTQANRIVHVVAKSGETTFKGIEGVTITEGDTFNPMAGVTATDTVDGDITKSVKVINFVNTKVPGGYLVIYTVTNSTGVETTAYRIVMVEPGKDMNPVIVGVEDQTIYPYGNITIGTGVKAYDADGNEIKYSVRGDFDNITPGVRTITYTATDAQGRTTTVVKTVTVLEKN